MEMVMANSLISVSQPRKLFKRTKKSSSLPSLPQNPTRTTEDGHHPSQPGGALPPSLGPQITNKQQHLRYHHQPHQRSRSASASTPAYRPRYDDRFLIPVPPVPVYRSSTMGSVVGPSPAIARFSPESDVATGNFAIRSGRPINTPAGGYGAMQQPRRAVSMTPGSYAQFDNRPVVYDRNGRPLSSASSNGSTAMTRDSFESRMRSPASSRTSFESWESHPKRPEYGWQRPAPIKQQRRKAQPGEQMAALPDEVLDMIMSEVRKLHLGKTSTSCATCMMRDFCSVALSSRRLLKIGRHALYEDIHLVGPDSQHQKKRLKIQYGSRMILLRRTLRSSPRIAAMVQSLRLPAQPPGMPIDQYLNLLASVIMACPNLERLAGPHQSYDHTFNRLVHALSTRNKLKEMTWVVEASSSQRQHRAPNVDTEPEELLPQQSTAFLELNMHWSQLTTLTIHCLPEAALTPVSLVTTALSTMPALQHLHLSKLSAASFDDTDLLALPPLKTLSLTSLPGITNAGLTAYFTARRPSQPLKSLTLQHLDLHSLPALGRLFLNFGSLEKFALVQSTTPILPEGEVIWLFPYLASNTLRKLHWDITSHENCANVADSVLAKSIAAGGFPSLHNLRAPNDPEGLFQNLCRPVEKIEKPSDKYRGRGLVAQIDSGPSTPRTPTTPMKSPAKSPFMPQMQPMKLSTDLHQARRAAQARLEEARNTPRFTVNVIEEDGSVVEKFGLGGFLGEVGSQIEYCLSPDPGAKDENGGLVQMSDVLSMKAEEGDDLDGCTGRWNSFGDINYDKKEKERWWHTERANWTEVRLS